MRFTNDSLSNPWIPALLGLAAGILLGWLVFSPLMSPIHTVEGGPRNLQGRHLDTFVSALVPYAEDVRSGMDQETRDAGITKLGEALCYPIEDYEIVKARQEALSAVQEENPTAAFTVIQYDAVLDMFDTTATEEATACDKFRELNPEAFAEGGQSRLAKWLIPLLFLVTIGGIALLLLNLRGVSLKNLNRPSIRQRQRRPRGGQDRQEGRKSRISRVRTDKADQTDWDQGQDSDDYMRAPELDAVAPDPVDEEPVSYVSHNRPPRREQPERAKRPERRESPPAPAYTPPPSRTYVPDDLDDDVAEIDEEPEPEPILSDDGGFTATYSRGDESFERVFEIYGADNQYLGDCSIEIADVLGSNPADVIAFKVRLFEAGMPRSITKLVMSEHAFNDSSLKAKLSTQGEAIMATMGEPLTLDGNMITVDTYITELLYSNDSGQPVRSVFDRVSVKLKAFVNRPDDSVDDHANILEF